MGQPITIVGSSIFLFINNQLYKQVQAIKFSVDYGEDGIYGIDTPYAQEIAGSRLEIKGTIIGLRTKLSGGLQGANMRPLFTDLAASPYVSIRVQDRVTGEDIVLIQSAKISVEDHSVGAKGVYQLNCSFMGQIPLFALDRAD